MRNVNILKLSHVENYLILIKLISPSLVHVHQIDRSFLTLFFQSRFEGLQ